MKVLIGITSKNRVSILPKAINSAIEQNYPDKEVMVYDDASADGTAGLVTQYPQVKWLISEVTHGYLYARNLFLTQSDAGIFCSLDDDSWFLNNTALTTAVSYMEANPDTGAIAFDILSPDDTDKVQLLDVEPVETNKYIGCGHLLRVDIVKQLGGYSPNPGYYGGEEKDLCIRLIDAGYKIIKLKGLYIWHDKTNVARDEKKQHRSGVCNDMVFTFRRTPGILLLPSLIIKLYKHFIFGVKYKKGFLLVPCLKGLADFFLFLFTFKLKRKAVSVKAFKKYLSLQN